MDISLPLQGFGVGQSLIDSGFVDRTTLFSLVGHTVRLGGSPKGGGMPKLNRLTLGDLIGSSRLNLLGSIHYL